MICDRWECVLTHDRQNVVLSSRQRLTEGTSMQLFSQYWKTANVHMMDLLAYSIVVSNSGLRVIA
jgi:hypothetical protein